MSTTSRDIILLCMEFMVTPITLTYYNSLNLKYTVMPRQYFNSLYTYILYSMCK